GYPPASPRQPGRTLDALLRAAAAPLGRIEVRRVRPMLAENAPAAFSGPGWVFELKHDGVRALVERGGDQVRLVSRTGRDIRSSVPEIALAGGALGGGDLLLDGEIVALDERGASSFEHLQGRLGQTNPHTVARLAREIPAFLYAFDLLGLAGHDLRALPLV